MKSHLKLIKSEKSFDDGVREMTMDEAYELHFPDLDSYEESKIEIKNELFLPAA